MFYFRFVISYLIIISINNYVLIRFKKLGNQNYNDEYSPEKFIEDLYTKYYSTLNVGYPPQETEVQITHDNVGLRMTENICLTSYYYNKNKSITLNQTHIYDPEFGKKEAIYANDSITFPLYNHTTKKYSEAKFPDYIFIYKKYNQTDVEYLLEKEKEAKACITFGFKILTESSYIKSKNIPYYLKEKKITNNTNFHFIYHTNKKDGYDLSLIIGELPHVYNHDFKEENYYKARAQDFIFEPLWLLHFHNYFYLKNGTKISMDFNDLNPYTSAHFEFHLDIIIGIKDYLKIIQAEYFDNHKECTFDLISRRYTVITCEKNFNSDDFPAIYFASSELNYTFVLTHKDLFEVRGNRKYFLIIFDNRYNYPWRFGRIFLQKYFFNFETDSRLIGHYVDDPGRPEDKMEKEPPQEEESSSKYFVIMWILLIIITAIIFFFIGKLVYDKKIKKRANELDDDYEYYPDKKKDESKDEKDMNKDDKLGID